MALGRHDDFGLAAAFQRERQGDIDLVEAEKRRLRPRKLHRNANSMDAATDAGRTSCASNSRAEKRNYHLRIRA